MPRRERLIRGIPVSHGLALGTVFVYRSSLPDLQERLIKPRETRREVDRFRRAVRGAQRDLTTLYGQVEREMGRAFAEFIDVQLALLTDEDVLTETVRFIEDRGRNAEFAYAETLKRLARPITGSVFKERGLDVVDVGTRVLRHLLGEDFPSLHNLAAGSVIVAHDLPPSEAALLDARIVKGLVLEGGGKTSHTAIMAKAKEIPAVVGVGPVSHEVHDGEQVIVDGYRGMAVLRPTRTRLRAFESDVELHRRQRRSLSRLTAEEPVTLDGKMIDLSANIEFVVEAEAARRYRARGVGLFRTEYIYLAKRRPPTEDEQYALFARVAKMLKPWPVIIRTFDLGGDKVIPGYAEANPFLGWRALRLCFDNPELLKGQIRAVLRASSVGNVKLMFPMVSTLDELRRAKRIVEDAKRELKRDGIRFDRQMEIGVMIETPSAALTADRIAAECSFLSVGSNDLTQYTLAVDRANERVAPLYDNLHPAVLQLIGRTVEAAHRAGIWVGLCGEFASDPLGVLVLLGLGIDELSVAPGLLAETKRIIRSIDAGSASEVVAETLRLGTAREVKRLLSHELHVRFPKLAQSLALFRDGGGDGDDGQ